MLPEPAGKIRKRLEKTRKRLEDFGKRFFVSANSELIAGGTFDLLTIHGLCIFS